MPAWLREQRLYEGGQRSELAASHQKQRARGDPRVNPMRSEGGACQQTGRADLHPRQRRQRATLPVQLVKVGQRHQRGTALVLHNVFDLDPTAQRGRQNATRAGS